MRPLVLIFCGLMEIISGRHHTSANSEVERENRYLLDSTPQTVWASWEQYAACATRCIPGYEKDTQACCSTGNNMVCLMLPWQILKPLVGTCPVGGQWDDWSNWSQCAATCGVANMSRTRTCVTDPVLPTDQNCTGVADESRSCNLPDCPVDGVWHMWASWSHCTTTCGVGSRARRRSCYFQPRVPAGNYCAGSGVEKQDCNTGLCPVDGVWEMWANWTSCTTTCGIGTRARRRTCYFQPGVPQGSFCAGSGVQQKFCTRGLCPVDGVWQMWGNWSQCTTTCGGGTHLRTRDCYFQPGVPKGKFCVGSGSEKEGCNTALCPVDGVWHTWGNWSQCTTTCGDGTRARRRTCYFQPRVPQGNYCAGTSVEKQDCNTRLCPVDGVWQMWGNWSHCTTTCGGGTHARKRDCYFQPRVPQGEYCVGRGVEKQDCNTALCPVDGVWTSWSTWTHCSRTCGTGTKRRSRACLYSPFAPHGDTCIGQTREQNTCHDAACSQRSCYECTGPPEVCENQYTSNECSRQNELYCINGMVNLVNGTRKVIRRCGTVEMCVNNWLNKYSLDSRCTSFNESETYYKPFGCEFCCTTDNCNGLINPRNKFTT